MHVISRIVKLFLLMVVLVTAACTDGPEGNSSINASEKDSEESKLNAPEKAGWVLMFHDDFTGTAIDASKWEHAPEWERHNGEWSNEDAYVNGEGQLIIRIDERDEKYYSGAIRTKELFEQTYGFFEIRADIPREEGFWTAFWLMSDSVHQVGDEGREGTEIDIYETPFSNRNGDYIQHALHWDGYGKDHKNVGKTVRTPGIYEGYHTFALEWNEDEYIFYVDDEETWRTSAGGVSQVSAYMKISAEVGDWGGNIEKADLPAELKVDYVRVYERENE